MTNYWNQMYIDENFNFDRNDRMIEEIGKVT